MTFEDLKNHYKTGYKFHKATGMSQQNFVHWRRKGYIPIESQVKIQHLTNNELKADLEHLKR